LHSQNTNNRKRNIGEIVALVVEMGRNMPLKEFGEVTVFVFHQCGSECLKLSPSHVEGGQMRTDFLMLHHLLPWKYFFASGFEQGILSLGQTACDGQASRVEHRSTSSRWGNRSRTPKVVPPKRSRFEWIHSRGERIDPEGTKVFSLSILPNIPYKRRVCKEFALVERKAPNRWNSDGTWR